MDGRSRGGIIDIPGQNMIRELLVATGCQRTQNKTIPKRRQNNVISTIYNVGTRYTSVLIPYLKLLNDNPDDDFTQTEIQLNREREENKHLIGLPYFKERQRLCVCRNPATNTCNCKSSNKKCIYEFKCKICYEKFKS